MICITANASNSVKTLISIVITLTILLTGQLISLANQTTIDNIRVHQFKSKTRVVLDFSSSFENYKITNNQNNTSIIFNDTAISADLTNLIPLNNNYGINIVQNNDNLELKFNVPSKQLATFKLQDPDRFIIDVLCVQNSTETATKQPARPGKEIYPGLSHKQYVLKGPVVANVLDIDLNNPMIDLKPVTAGNNTLFYKKNINQMIYSSNSLAGINASFFKPPTGLPLGILIIDKDYYTGPIFNRVALVIDEDNKAYLDKVKIESFCILPDGNVLKIQNINQPRLSVEGFMLYTDKWNAGVTKTLKNELQIAILDGKIINKTTGSLTVPSKGFVITGPNKDNFKKLNIGDPITILSKTVSSVPNIKHAIGGGPYLIKNGDIFIDSHNENFSISPHSRDPRTAVGITADNHVLLVTVDGRQKGSVGMSFYQLAQFLKSLGAVEAMNFDGGSSTQMGLMGRMVNRPTVRGGAQVSTGIIVKPTEKISIANKPI